jgi:hypothetical protein
LRVTRSLEIPLLSTTESCLKEGLLSEPLITAIGAGTTYPDYQPAPLAAEEARDDVDVVTTVTECPLTMSSVMVKIDTKRPIGQETALVRHRGRVVGHVSTEQYGSKMINIGGINLIKNLDTLGALVLTRLMVAICNRQPISLSVDEGAELELQVGKPPIVNGEETSNMALGCGTAIIAMFGDRLKEIADEVVVLDSDITCLCSESYVGRILGFSPSGITPPGRFGNLGRYHPEPGPGWGGTQVMNPKEAIASVDRSRIRPGLRILVLEVTGCQAAMLEVDENLDFQEVEMPPKGRQLCDLIRQNSEPAETSALYIGGAGGSARAGITPHPVKLNRAIHNETVKLTVGGAPAFVFPGGGITFMVDVGKIGWEIPFGWVPMPPALVVPLEYTMTKETYLSLEGHRQNLHLLSEIKEVASGKFAVISPNVRTHE